MRAKITLTLLLAMALVIPVSSSERIEMEMGSVERSVMDNGMVVITKSAESPLTYMYIGFKKDVYEEKSGLSNLMAQMLLEGTEKRSAEAISNETESSGASLSAASDYHSITLAATFPEEAYSEIFEIVNDCLTNSTFPSEGLATKKKETLGIIEYMENIPAYKLFIEFNKIFYKGTPYEYLPQGTRESLNNITIDDIKRCYADDIHSDNCVVCVVGDVSHGDVIASCKALSLKKGAKERIESEITLSTAERETTITEPGFNSTYVAIGYQAPELTHEDSSALTLLGQILGGGADSRLFKTLRVGEGLVYGASAGYGGQLGPSYLLITSWFDPSDEKRASNLIRNEVEKIKIRGITDEELEKVKLMIRSAYESMLVNPQYQGAYLFSYEVLGLGADYLDTYLNDIESTTTEEVEAAAKKYLRNPVTVLIKP
jgi:zinc protease